MGGGYAYAGDNPVNRVDPSGEAWLHGAYFDGGHGGQGCTMDIYEARPCIKYGDPGSPPAGTCTNWGAVAFGVGVLVLFGVIAVLATIVAPEIWFEPH
jgi:hypothetical protein